MRTPAARAGAAPQAKLQGAAEPADEPAPLPAALPAQAERPSLLRSASAAGHSALEKMAQDAGETEASTRTCRAAKCQVVHVQGAANARTHRPVRAQRPCPRLRRRRWMRGVATEGPAATPCIWQRAALRARVPRSRGRRQQRLGRAAVARLRASSARCWAGWRAPRGARCSAWARPQVRRHVRAAAARAAQLGKCPRLERAAGCCRAHHLCAFRSQARSPPRRAACWTR